MAAIYFPQYNICFRTYFASLWTPCCKAATWFGIDRTGDFPFNDFVILCPVSQVRGGNRFDQRLRIRMQRISEELYRRGPFHALPQIHYSDVFADMFHHTQIVGDEHIGKASFVLQIHQQIQYLGLYGNVQGGYRFITHDKFGIQGQGPGDADSLPPAAVQFMGIRIDQSFSQTDGLHQFINPVIPGIFIGLTVMSLNLVGDGLRDALDPRLKN